MFMVELTHPRSEKHTSQKDTSQRWVQLPGPDIQVRTRCCCEPLHRCPSFQLPAREASDWTGGLPSPAHQTRNQGPAGFPQWFPQRKSGLPLCMTISFERQRKLFSEILTKALLCGSTTDYIRVSTAIRHI